MWGQIVITHCAIPSEIFNLNYIFIRAPVGASTLLEVHSADCMEEL